MPSRRLYAEWEQQKSVLVSFPHEDSDWVGYLDEAQVEFVQLIENIALFTPVIVICKDQESILPLFKNRENLRFLDISTNDTWIRDYGPISVETETGTEYLDFGFNGWGLKFAANCDNAVTKALHEKGELPNVRTPGLILEGGSIESNGSGELLTTSQCLLEPNRNPHLDKGAIAHKLREWFGLRKVHFLNHGHLVGDDTDAHIDTLARFVSKNAIVYVKCYDKSDVHFEELQKMEAELQELRSADGEPFELHAIPLPKKIVYEGERLPATYANFLITNDGVIVPSYGLKSDAEVNEILQDVFRDKTVVMVPSSILIRQHGSIHCSTMQLY